MNETKVQTERSMKEIRKTGRKKDRNKGGRKKGKERKRKEKKRKDKNNCLGLKYKTFTNNEYYKLKEIL